jgi:hypothetical protein
MTSQSMFKSVVAHRLLKLHKGRAIIQGHLVCDLGEVKLFATKEHLQKTFDQAVTPEIVAQGRIGCNLWIHEVMLSLKEQCTKEIVSHCKIKSDGTIIDFEDHQLLKVGNDHFLWFFEGWLERAAQIGKARTAGEARRRAQDALRTTLPTGPQRHLP